MSFAVVQQHPRYRTTAAVGVFGQNGDLEQLPLEDISLGGAFIRTMRPRPPGSFVLLRLPIHQAPVMGRVVHIIDEATSLEKSRAPGMGIQFDGLSPDHELSLRRFVDAVVEEERRARSRRESAWFVDATHVAVNVERIALARMWAAGLSAGTLEASGAGRVGNRVTVSVGPVQLTADVIGVSDELTTLRIVDLQGEKHHAIERFVEGAADSLRLVAATKPLDPALAHALSEARRFFQAVDAGDPFAALGVTRGAAAADVAVRARELAALFGAAYADATPPQRARLGTAAVAVAGVERAIMNEMRTAAIPQDVAGDRVRELVADAAHLASLGEHDHAKSALLAALELAPGDYEVKARLHAVNESVDRARAMELLNDIGLPTEAVIERALEAVQLSAARDVLVGALRVLASVGADDDAVRLAERCLDQRPDDEVPLYALLHLHEKAHRWALAARAGEALLRLRPTDDTLRARVRAAALAAREP